VKKLLWTGNHNHLILGNIWSLGKIVPGLHAGTSSFSRLPCGVWSYFLGLDINPHQYTLRSLLIRTPGVHLDPSGISSFITQIHDDVVSEMIFLNNQECDMTGN